MDHPQKDLYARPYSSQYAEKPEHIHVEPVHHENYGRVPQSAREGHLSHQHSLRNFKERSRTRSGSAGGRGISPGFVSGNRGREESGMKSGPGTFDGGYEPVGISKKHSELPLAYSERQRSMDREERERHHPVSNYEDNLKRVQDMPDLQQIKEKFISSQRVQNIVRSTFGDPTAPQMLYKSAEETLTDIQRLIMLEDFDGLRRRVMQMYKERQTCEQLLQTKDIELNELREQVNIREDSVRQVEELNARNLDEYLKSMQEMKSQKHHVETQSSFRITALQESIEQQTQQLEDLQRTKQHEAARLEQLAEEAEAHRRKQLEAEAKAERLTEENQKLYTNYDVLKEHELNIIKDFQDRKVHDQKNLDDQIAELRRQIDERTANLGDSRRQIAELEDGLRKAEFETKKVLDQKSMALEHHGVVQSKLDKEKADNQELREKMALLEAELDAEQEKCRNEAKEKKLAYTEIK